MKQKERQKWNGIRAKGIWRFIFVNVIVLGAIPVWLLANVLSFLLSLTEQNQTFEQVLQVVMTNTLAKLGIGLTIFVVWGLILGFWICHQNEGKLRRAAL